VWRAALRLPGGELPFFIEFDTEDGRRSGYLVNGDERVRIDRVELSEESILLELPTFKSRIEASSSESGIVGTLEVVKTGQRVQRIPFRATPGGGDRFMGSSEAPSIDVTGRWSATFVDDVGTASPAVGEFRQDGSRVVGTFLTPTGDYRYLEGNVAGDRLRLSCFDGYHVFLFDATVLADGSLSGDFWSGLEWHESWTAVRNDEARLPDANALTYLKPGYRQFDFAFPDTTGRTVSLSDRRFEGKVVVVSIGGSWCPNCHDEAAFLADYHRRNRDRGIEVVGLMYEHFDDFKTAAKQVQTFAKKFGIEYELLVAGVSDKDEASKTLPMLNHVLAYPTTIFVDRTGAVRRIHTGFSGPGTGEHYKELIRDFTDYVDFLAQESSTEKPL
jgi:peroxiredoxin